MPTVEAMESFYAHYYRQFYYSVEKPDGHYIQRLELDKRAACTASYLEESRLIRGKPAILDVGCAEGSLLREIGTRIPDAFRVGIEPTPGFAEFARTHARCDVYPSLDELRRSSVPRFDLIIATHVLEHVVDPVQFLGQLHDFLNSGGCVYLDVPDLAAYPNVASLHIAHLYHFSKRTLSMVVETAGYLVASTIESYQPPKVRWNTTLQ